MDDLERLAVQGIQQSHKGAETVAARFKAARTVYNQHGRQAPSEVAKKTGIQKAMICDLEREDSGSNRTGRNVGYKEIVVLADYYGVSLDWLLGSGQQSQAEHRLTADKIFRQLGYERAKSEAPYPLYEKQNGVAIEIALPDCIGKFCRNEYYPESEEFTADEIFAIAQLIREMEADNG